ncbi:hypothetical protein A5791_12815 [Mycobacterium sp. 852002-51163_SCH5372311]|nr:hypothetical protein A5791_12815 [Mycobacterium sp. 852002-51163_SCH5372311]
MRGRKVERLGLIVLMSLIFGAITGAIARKKNLSTGGWFVIGAFLGLIGLLIVLMQRPRLPKPPPGMRVVKCSWCNAVQNIAEAQPEFECWQCKASHRIWDGPQPELTEPATMPQQKPVESMSKVRCYKCQHVQAVPPDLSSFPCEECGASLKRRTS